MPGSRTTILRVTVVVVVVIAFSAFLLALAEGASFTASAAACSSTTTPNSSGDDDDPPPPPHRRRHAMDKLAALVARTPVRDLVHSLARNTPAAVPGLTAIFSTLAAEGFRFERPPPPGTGGAAGASSGRAAAEVSPEMRAAAEFLRQVAPPLDDTRHKGQGGRIGLLGGSVDYAGAPYYAGISALRTGAELLTLFTAEEATGPIKGYSPELMVSGVYRYSHMGVAAPGAAADPHGWKTSVRAEQDRMVARVQASLPRLHALAIGPGLGRDPNVLAATARVLTAARAHKVPLVIDADGVFLVSQHPDLVRGRSPGAPVVLTPNVREFALLATAVTGDANASLEEVARRLDGPIILRKGAVDQICGPSGRVYQCAQQGAPRRPGGLGDLLSGAVGTVVAWTAGVHAQGGVTLSSSSSSSSAAAAAALSTDGSSGGAPAPLTEEFAIMEACCTASTLVRRACEAAYARKHRSMMAPDVLEELGDAVEELFPAPKLL